MNKLMIIFVLLIMVVCTSCAPAPARTATDTEITDNLQSQINDICGRVDRLEAFFMDNRKLIDELKSLISLKDASMSEVTANLEGLRGNIALLNQDMNQFRKDVAEIKKYYAGDLEFNKRIQKLESSAATFEDKLADIQGEIEGIQDNLH